MVTHSFTARHQVDDDGYNNKPDSDTKNSYVWWDNAVQDVTTYRPDMGSSNIDSSTFHYDDSGHLQSVFIEDGRDRTVSFLADANGQILTRDEEDSHTSHGDPRELHYYFNGLKVGDVSNNGTSDIDYAAGIAARYARNGGWAFRGGGDAAITYADFDQSYDPINGLSYESTASRYTVNAGDTLESIAAQIWGDGLYIESAAGGLGLIWRSV